MLQQFFAVLDGRLHFHFGLERGRSDLELVIQDHILLGRRGQLLPAADEHLAKLTVRELWILVADDIPVPAAELKAAVKVREALAIVTTNGLAKMEFIGRNDGLLLGLDQRLFPRLKE